MNRTRPLLAATLFVACILAANYATSHYGLIALPLGLAVTAGTFAAGLALLARDVVQEEAGRLAVIALISAGALLSYAIANPRIAAASGIAFACSELADMAIYTPLRHRGWNRAVLASNAVGALIDSALFLTIAGFGLTSGAIAGQWLVKMAVTAATLLLVGGARALRSHTLQRRSA